MVRASRPISSSVWGSGTRRWIVPPLMASTSARIASTGRSARPTSTHATAATAADQQRDADPQALADRLEVLLHLVDRRRGEDGQLAGRGRDRAAEPFRLEGEHGVGGHEGGAAGLGRGLLVGVERCRERAGTGPVARRPRRRRTSGSAWVPAVAPAGVRPAIVATPRSGGPSPRPGGERGTDPRIAPPSSSIWMNAGVPAIDGSPPTSALIAVCTASSGGVPSCSSATTSSSRSSALVAHPRRLRVLDRADQEPPGAPSPPPRWPTTAARVIRTRTDRSARAGPGADVSHRAPAGSRRRARSAGCAAERRVDLAAQVADVDLDDVGVAVEVVAPHLAQQVVLGDDVAAAAQQRLEQRELPGGQRRRDVAPAAGAARPGRARGRRPRASAAAAPRPAAPAPAAGPPARRTRTAWTGSRRRRCRAPRPRRTRRSWP